MFVSTAFLPIISDFAVTISWLYFAKVLKYELALK